MMETASWEARADCKDRDPKLWDGDHEYENEVAKRICLRCPVRDKCLADAMVNEEKFTVRGAHTAEEREIARPEWLKKHYGHINLLKQQYKRKNLLLSDRLEARLEKCRLVRRLLRPGHPRFEDFSEVLDLVIAKPEATAEELGRRIGRSGSYVQHVLCEAWEMAS